MSFWVESVTARHEIHEHAGDWKQAVFNACRSLSRERRSFFVNHNRVEYRNSSGEYVTLTFLKEKPE